MVAGWGVHVGGPEQALRGKHRLSIGGDRPSTGGDRLCAGGCGGSMASVVGQGLCSLERKRQGAGLTTEEQVGPSLCVASPGWVAWCCSPVPQPVAPLEILGRCKGPANECAHAEGHWKGA